MKTRGWVISLAMAIEGPPLANAAGLEYECRVAAVSTVGPQGNLVESSETNYVGTVFRVEKLTGTILGSAVGNSAYPKKQVLDPGGANESFKALTSGEQTAAGGVHTIYLEIAEYSQEVSKPFLAVEGGMVISGLCE
jgi:hypothetical protein